MNLSILISIITCCIAIIFIVFIIYFRRFKTVKPSKKFNKIANVTKRCVNDSDVYEIIPKENLDNNHTILYLHGGAYVGGITHNYWRFIYNFVKDTKCRVIVPDYPLLPKYTFNDVFFLVEKIYMDIVQNQKCILAGDSAGGAICLSLAEKMISEGKNIPCKTVVISPWLDVNLNNEKIDKVQKKDKILSKRALKIVGKMYAKEMSTTNYLISPIYGDISKIPNLAIFTGTNDILNPDVGRINDSDNVTVYESENAPHIWIVNLKKKYQGDYKKLIAFLKER